ncbi:MAG: DUF3857 domain-containing protein [Bacteroidota bacterium]
MKYTYIYIVSIAIAIAFSACSSCENKIENIDFSKEYPDADAVYLNITKEYTYYEDGTLNYHYSHSLKLLTYLSFNRLYGETFIKYNPLYQTLKINKSETVMNDGSLVPAPDNAFNEMLPFEAADASAYNNLREMVVTHTGLECGATINLDYEITSTADYFPELMAYEFIAESSPVREMTIRVKIPKNRELNYALLGDSSEVSIEETDEFKVYTLRMENIPPTGSETMSAVKTWPRFLFSTGKLGDNLAAMMKQENKETKHEDCDTYIEGLRLSEPLITDAMNIRDFVLNEFNLYQVDLKLAAYRFRSPGEVWKSNGGTSFEKTLLLEYLLRKAGFNTGIVGSAESERFDPEVGSFAMGMDYFVKLEIGDHDYYLSALHGSEKEGPGSGCRLISFSRFDVSQIPESGLPDEVKLTGIISIISADNANAEISGYFTNKAVPSMKLLSGNEAVKTLISAGEIMEYKVAESGEHFIKADYSSSVAGKLTDKAGYFFFELPYATSGFSSWHTSYMVTGRNTPVELPSALKEEYHYTIEFPAEWKYLGSDTLINISNSAGCFTLKISVSDNGIDISRGLSYNKKLYSVEEYAALKEITDQWLNGRWTSLKFRAS